MTAGLEISPKLTLPDEFVTATQAILARKGSGKSYTASVQAEEMLEAGHQVVVIDPTGAWWGLRASADGKSDGFSIAVLGGDHADVPLEEHAGETVARAIVEERFSAVIDLSHFRKGQVTRFMTAFLETLYQLNREALHLFVDEADAVAPQKPYGDQARVLGAAEDVVRRGRLRGIGCTLITQRPAVLNKNVLTQCEVLTTLRLGHPRDIAAIREWIEVHADADQAKEMIASLPALPIGTAWIWSPAMDLFEKVKIRRRRTFDSGATPKAGERRKAPKVLAEVDVAKLGQAIAETAERAKANDPKTLRAEAERLRRRVAELEATPRVERVEVPLVSAEDRVALEQLYGRIGELLAVVRQPVPAAAPAPLPRAVRVDRPARPARVSRTPIESSDAVGNGGLRRILVALAQRPQGLTRSQIGIRAGLSSKSGTFSTYLSRARTSGWIDGSPSETMVITSRGLDALGPFDPLPTGAALLEHWLGELGNGGQARILRALADAFPAYLSKDELGDACGLSSGSGTFRTYLSRLRSLELIEGRSELRMSEELA